MNDSMIERVAAAMKKFVETPLPNPTNPPSVIDLQCVLAGCLGDVWKHIAATAIAAMREPTEAMKSQCVQAQIEIDTEDGPSMDEFGAQDLWQRMIDVAVKDAP